jgi:AraC family transcriptional regulator, regulator of nimT
MRHRVTMVGEVEMRSLYVQESLEGLPEACQVISVSPLLREMIAAFTTARLDYAPQGPESRLASVILDLLRAPVLATLHLPMPGSARLRPIVEAILADPSDPRGLKDWARIAGASARTLARLFEAEAGMGFRAWRQQVRLHAALARLSAGEAVTSVAFAVGYDSPSAFIAMFRKALGASPQKYLKREGSLPAETLDA